MNKINSKKEKCMIKNEYKCECRVYAVGKKLITLKRS